MTSTCLHPNSDSRGSIKTGEAQNGAYIEVQRRKKNERQWKHGKEVTVS